MKFRAADSLFLTFIIRCGTLDELIEQATILLDDRQSVADDLHGNEMFFSEPVERELIEHYFGCFESATFARCQLYKALADIKWGYWSLVQMKQSALCFDFSKYGAWKFMRAPSVMHDGRWPSWLEQVARS